MKNILRSLMVIATAMFLQNKMQGQSCNYVINNNYIGATCQVVITINWYANGSGTPCYGLSNISLSTGANPLSCSGCSGQITNV
jgi:hypothetical protein